jgi:hypothetical protein
MYHTLRPTLRVGTTTSASMLSGKRNTQLSLSMHAQKPDQPCSKYDVYLHSSVFHFHYTFHSPDGRGSKK